MPKRKYKKKPYVHEIATSVVKWKKPKGNQMMIGYARVSMADQNNQRQIDELIRFGVHPSDIFKDKLSGKTMDRPAWKACNRDLQKGDWLVVYAVDRLGRSLKDLINIEQELFDRGVKLKVISQPVDTSTAAGRFHFHMIAATAQFEREKSWERTVHGLKAARERNVIGGRASKYSDKEIRAAIKKAGTDKGAARVLGCKAITIKRRRQMWAEGRKLQLPVKK